MGGSLNLEGVEKITVKARNSGLKLILRDTAVIWSGTVDKSTEDRTLLLTVTSDELVLSLPSNYEISLSTVSGDLKVVTEEVKNPVKLTLNCVSGDVEVEDFPPGEVTISNVSGDVSLEGSSYGNPELWKDADYSVTTVSGDVDLKGTLFSNLTINTISGDVSVVVPEKKVPRLLAPVLYSIKTVSGSVSDRVEGRSLKEQSKDGRTYFYDYGDIQIETKSKFRFHFEIYTGIGNRFLDFNPRTGGPILYNRVDGLVLGIAQSFGKRTGHYAKLGISRSFLRKKWQYWMEVQGQLFKKPGIFLVAEAFNTTATYDKWIMGDAENTVAAFLFKRDYRDYFLRKGMSIGLAITPFKGVRFEARLEDSKIDTLSKRANWSLFGRDEPFRPNIVTRTGGLTALDLSLKFRIYYFDLYLNYLRPTKESEIEAKRTFLLLRGEKSWGENQLLGRLVLGDCSDTTLPFGFWFGGIGTVPAYPYKHFGGERVAILNLEYGVKIKFLRFLVFYDRGEVLKGGTGLAHDVGLGFALGGLSLRMAHALTEEGSNLKVFLRLRKRF
jgi:hypothetical protein